MRLRLAALALLMWPSSAKAAGHVLVPLDGPPKAVKKAEWAVTKAFEKLGTTVKVAPLSLEDVRLAVDCAEDSPACWGQIATMLEADVLLVGSVEPAGNGMQLALRRLDQKGKSLGEINVVLPGSQDDDVDALFRALGGKTSPVEEPVPSAAPAVPTTAPPTARSTRRGTLVIRADVAGVEVELDGEPRGQAPLTLDEVEEGRYRVDARKPGYYPWQGEASVMRQSTATVEIRLIPAPDGKGQSAWSRIRRRTWVTAGVGGALVAVGGIFALRARSAQSDVDASTLATPEDYAALSARADQGEGATRMANLGLIGGGVTLVAATVLAWLDLRAGPTSAVASEEDGIAWHW